MNSRGPILILSIGNLPSQILLFLFFQLSRLLELIKCYLQAIFIIISYNYGSRKARLPFGAAITSYPGHIKDENNHVNSSLRPAFCILTLNKI